VARKPPKVLINALHTSTGGGVTYLRGILPRLANDIRARWILLATPKLLELLEIPGNVEVKVAPEMGFAKGHLWEQLVLPWTCRAWGVRRMLCNANYVPLLAPRPVPVLHTTPRVAQQVSGIGWWLYWTFLKTLTVLSLWRAPRALSVARHVVGDYVGAWVGRKVRVASPAVIVPAGEATVNPDLIITVGDFYPQKDYPLLVRALEKVRARRPKARLMIVGRAIDTKVRDEVLALIRELKLADAVTLTGAMPHDKVLANLKRAAVYVSTSSAECFNIPVLEALACGVPCVLNDTDFQVEVAGDAAVYVPAHKGGDVAAAYAAAICGVMEDAAVAATLRRMGLARAAGFSWEKTARIVADTVLGMKGA